MKFVYAYLNNRWEVGKITASIVVQVPGIGEIKVDQTLSDDLRNRIVKESLAVVRQRLGMPLVEDEPESNAT